MKSIIKNLFKIKRGYIFIFLSFIFFLGGIINPWYLIQEGLGTTFDLNQNIIYVANLIFAFLGIFLFFLGNQIKKLPK
jgi:hypothetical protein